MKRRSLIIAGYLLATHTFADNLPDFRLCQEKLRQLNLEYQLAAIGRRKDSLSESLPAHYSTPSQLAQWMKDGSVPPKDWFSELHEDVLDYLVADPTKQDLALFRTKYGMTDEQALNVLTYYASRHYFNALRNLGDPRVILRRLSDLARAHRLTDPTSRLARLYPFYLIQLTQKSVPEIASMLGIKEVLVYQDLSELGISIEKEFAPYLEKARPMLAAGISVADTAARVGVGADALTFVLHYEDEINKGIPWKRELEHEGKPYEEEKLLEELWSKHSTTDIAAILNEAAGTNPGDKLYRTPGAIAAKAKRLGLTNPGQRDFSDLRLEGYGLVKENGALQDAAINFLYDNHDIPLKDLADRLEVDIKQLRGFLRRKNVVLAPPPMGGTRLPSPLTDEQHRHFLDSETGLLEQWSSQHKGSKNRTNEVIEDFAIAQIPEPGLQAQVLRKIAALQIRPKDGANAQRHRQAETRLFTALQIIAEAKGEKLRALDHEEGQRIFGLSLIRKVETEPSAELTKTETDAFLDRDNGLLLQLHRNTAGLTGKPEEVLVGVANKQISDPAKQAEAIARIRRLGFTKSDHTHASINRKPWPTRRFVQALRIIAEAKGQKLTALNQTEGTAVFGFKPLVVNRIPAPLSKTEQSNLLNPKHGLLAQFLRNVRGSQRHLRVRLLELAKARIPAGASQDEAVSKIEALGMPDRANPENNATEIADALRLIAQASGEELKDLSEAEGNRVFGWDLHVEPLPVPPLSPEKRSEFRSGLLQQALRIRGISSNAANTMEKFAKSQISDEVELQKAIGKLRRLGLKENDGTQVRAGFLGPADRLFEAFRIVAEHKGEILENATRDEGTRVFGFDP